MVGNNILAYLFPNSGIGRRRDFRPIAQASMSTSTFYNILGTFVPPSWPQTCVHLPELECGFLSSCTSKRTVTTRLLLPRDHRSFIAAMCTTTVNQQISMINQPNVQFREKRPLLTELSVWKITKRDELDDVIVDMATAQNLPSDDELVLEPSYSDTLSYLQLAWCSKFSSMNVTDTTCNIRTLT